MRLSNRFIFFTLVGGLWACALSFPARANAAPTSEISKPPMVRPDSSTPPPAQSPETAETLQWSSPRPQPDRELPRVDEFHASRRTPKTWDVLLGYSAGRLIEKDMDESSLTLGLRKQWSRPSLNAYDFEASLSPHNWAQLGFYQRFELSSHDLPTDVGPLSDYRPYWRLGAFQVITTDHLPGSIFDLQRTKVAADIGFADLVDDPLKIGGAVGISYGLRGLAFQISASWGFEP